MSLYRAFFSIGIVGILTGCLEQYDPTKHLKKFEDERTIAHRELLSLTEDGNIPAPSTTVQANSNPIEETYKNYCSSCHGMEGNADTPTGHALKPGPRNFTDTKWQASVDDAHIGAVIKEGGAKNGLSPMMAPWGSVLSEDQIKQMIQKIRSFKK